MNVRHCDQLMKTKRTPLISGRIQYDHLCTACGHREREIYTRGGLAISWTNMDHRKRVAEVQPGA